jgi:hypothetical protein
VASVETMTTEGPETNPESPATPPPGLPTRTSERRLSTVAKRLLVPSGIVDSYWREVKPVCEDQLGITLDRWQDGIAGLALSHRADGNLAHTVGGLGLCVCRQAGKTHTLTCLMFGLCVKYPGILAIWTSHHVKTNTETFMAVQSYAKRVRIAPFIDKVFTGSGDEEVRFRNGSRILFGARERGFGRGIPGVDVLMSDEAQILSQRAMQDMLATMNTSRLGLHMYAGTPPKPGDNSENFTRMRQEAIAGDATDMVWIEFGADDDCDDIDDVEQWKKANPSVPHRTPIISIRRLRRRLDDDGFRREALGLWDNDDVSVFDLIQWGTLVNSTADPPHSVALVIDVSPDRRYASIGVAGTVGTDDGDKSMVLVQSMKGTAAVMPRVQKLIDSRDIVDVSITSGAARALEPDLVKAGIKYTKLSTADMAAGYATLQEAIKSGTVCHAGQLELDTAMAMARTRTWLTGEAEVFDRRGYSVDVSPAVAAAGALYRWGLQEAPMPMLL